MSSVNISMKQILLTGNFPLPVRCQTLQSLQSHIKEVEVINLHTQQFNFLYKNIVIKWESCLQKLPEKNQYQSVRATQKANLV